MTMECFVHDITCTRMILDALQ